MSGELYKSKEYNRIIGSQIRKRRIWKDMSREKLAEKTGYSNNHIANIELGSSQPGVSLFHAICDVLDINASELLDEVKKELEVLNIES